MAQSRKTPWTVCWRGVTRRLFSPKTGYSTSFEESFWRNAFWNAEIDDHLGGEAQRRGSATGRERLFEEDGADRDPRSSICAFLAIREGDVRSEADCALSAPVSGASTQRRSCRCMQRGMTVRERSRWAICWSFMGLEISPDLISTVTQTPFWRRWPNGRTGRSNRCIRWFFFSPTRCGSKSATRGSPATRPSMSRSASRRKRSKRHPGPLD